MIQKRNQQSEPRAEKQEWNGAERVAARDLSGQGTSDRAEYGSEQGSSQRGSSQQGSSQQGSSQQGSSQQGSSQQGSSEQGSSEQGSSELKHVYRSNAPKTFPCPSCAVRGRRVRKRILEVTDLEHRQRVKIIGTVGVYKAKCECRKYFTSEIREASKGTEYSNRVRDEVVRLVVDEGLTYEQVRERLSADYLITVSIGTIHNWLKERNATPVRHRRHRAEGQNGGSARKAQTQRAAS